MDSLEADWLSQTKEEREEELFALREENKTLKKRIKDLEHTLWRWEEGDWARD